MDHCSPRYTPRMSPRRSRSSQVDSDHQLSLELSWLSEEELLGALRSRGINFVEDVRFRPNRSRLISLSADRRRLNVHDCFRAAPTRVIDAMASFATAPSRSRAFKDAVEKMREWHEGQIAEYGLGEPLVSCGTPSQMQYLDSVYLQLNDTHFRGGLPRTLPIRLSDRMSRRFGHVAYARTLHGDRKVAELALNIDLLLKGNEKALIDTVLHEMAHIEAWLTQGHREHGRIWRDVARRVGCEAKACTHMRLRRRRTTDPVTEVPVLKLPLAPPEVTPRTVGTNLKRAARNLR